MRYEIRTSTLSKEKYVTRYGDSVVSGFRLLILSSPAFALLRTGRLYSPSSPAFVLLRAGRRGGLVLFIRRPYRPQAGQAVTFSLDEKVTKKSRQNNASARHPAHPRYFAGPAHYLILLNNRLVLKYRQLVLLSYCLSDYWLKAGRLQPPDSNRDPCTPVPIVFGSSGQRTISSY